MSRRRRSPLILILSLTLVVLCLITAILLAAIPSQTEALFGPPAENLSTLDRLTLSLKLLASQELLRTPLNPAGTPVSFVIDSGESVVSIAARMVEAGLIPNADAWTDYLVYRGMDVAMQAGNYRLSPALSSVGIAEYMRDPRSHEINFAILPGWRLEEIAASLPSSGLAITPEEFLSFTQNDGVSSLDERLPAGLSSLEGYLLPGEYAIIHGASIVELLPMLLDRLFETVSGELITAYSAQGLSLEQAITLASLVEREAILDDEMPLIASVFLNRLVVGMRLESDPTVQYALGYDELSATWWKVPLAGSDLSIDSSYNTYIHTGLPPAPICNPSTEALQAVAYPESSGYYFFRAACDGSGRHRFSETYEEHLNNACQ
jgi:UPF0755 protein